VIAFESVNKLAQMATVSVRPRGPVSAIERGTEVATAITSIATKAIARTITIAQAPEATKATAKVTVVAAVVVGHCVRG
jgi:hypothetical protein